MQDAHGWQPISTAPTMQRVLVLLTPKYRADENRVRIAKRKWSYSLDRWEWVGEGFTTRTDSFAAWQPLPAPLQEDKP